MKSEMVPALLREPGQTFTRRDAVKWFHEHYPDVKSVTVTTLLTRIITNANSRMHYNASRDGTDDILF